MKKILILSHTRGISNYKIGSHHYANGLRSLGFDVTYLGVPYTVIHKLMKRSDQGEKQLEINVLEPSVNFLFPITLPRKYILPAFNILWVSLFSNKSEIFNQSYDAVICDYPFFEPYLKLIKYRKLIYRPTDNYVAMSGRKVIDFEREIVKKASKIVPTSKNVASNLCISYGLNKNDLHVIQNGFEDTMFNCNSDKERSGAIYIGAIDYRFDIDSLEVLLDNYRGEFFHIYGPIDKELVSKVDNLSESYNNVKFYGKIEYNKTAEKLKEAKVGLLLLNGHDSNLGRSPMKLWEYVASGLNVIYSMISITDERYTCFYHYSDKITLIKSFALANSQHFQNSNIEHVGEFSWKNKVNDICRYL